MGRQGSAHKLRIWREAEQEGRGAEACRQPQACWWPTAAHPAREIPWALIQPHWPCKQSPSALRYVQWIDTCSLGRLGLGDYWWAVPFQEQVSSHLGRRSHLSTSSSATRGEGGSGAMGFGPHPGHLLEHLCAPTQSRVGISCIVYEVFVWARGELRDQWDK